MDNEQTDRTNEQEQLIAELHTALNAVTALFVWDHGFEYGCVREALQVLEKSGRLYSLPIRAVLAQKIEGKEGEA